VLKRLAGLSLLIALPIGSALADFKSGLQAAQRGDYATAIQEWTLLAEQGDGAAQYNLAMLFDKGRGVSQDFKQAEHWYRKSAEQNFIWAQYAMGSLYERGEGVGQDYAQAADWYAKAATNNFSRAMNSLGRLYEAGLGVPKNLLVAHALAKLSLKADATEGNPARDSLKRLATLLSPQEMKAAERLREEMSLPGNLRNALEQLKAPAK
jgi:TPR repeat protein